MTAAVCKFVTGTTCVASGSCAPQALGWAFYSASITHTDIVLEVHEDFTAAVRCNASVAALLQCHGAWELHGHGVTLPKEKASEDGQHVASINSAANVLFENRTTKHY